jgi:hypothetical protein
VVLATGLGKTRGWLVRSLTLDNFKSHTDVIVHIGTTTVLALGGNVNVERQLNALSDHTA